jgi:hypothetical protein
MAGPREVVELKIREHPPSTLINVNDGPREVPKLKIRERPPSMLRNVDDKPPGGARVEDLEASTINAKNHR